MNWRETLSLHWWFTLRPGPLESAFIRWALVLLIIILFGSAVFCGVLRGRHCPAAFKKLYSKIIYWGATLGILSLVLLFFSFQEIPFLSMRLWWGLLFLGGMVWLVFILLSARHIPQKIQEGQRKKDEFFKYLPR